MGQCSAGNSTHPTHFTHPGPPHLTCPADMSWKVRRAAAKVLTAAVHSYQDAIGELYRRAAEPLVARFREREENVLSDVFQAYVVLCRQV